MSHSHAYSPFAEADAAVVIFSALFTALQRLMSDVATTTVGWATVLLFGRVPQAQQRLLALIALGSLLWLLAVACVVLPAAGGFVISVVPRPGFVLVAWLQASILILAIGLPLAIGLATAALDEDSSGPTALASHVLRDMTSAKESEQIEDRLARLAGAAGHVSATDFRPVDDLLASLAVPYDEWQTLYRLRLQVELQHRPSPA